MQWFSGAVHELVSKHPSISVGPALLVLGLFLYGYGWLVASVWFPIPMPSWPTSDGGRTFFTAFASLVGGIVAIGFGLKPSQAVVRAQDEETEEKFSKRKPLARSLLGLGDALTAGMQPKYNWYWGIALLFSGCYAAVGFVGWFAWQHLESLENAPHHVAALGDFEKVFFSGSAGVLPIILTQERHKGDKPQQHDGSPAKGKKEGQTG